MADVKAQIQHMRETPGFMLLMQHWNVQREQIISEAKAARASEKQIKNLARLDGFDEAVAVVARMAREEEVTHSDPELGE